MTTQQDIEAVFASLGITSAGSQPPAENPSEANPDQDKPIIYFPISGATGPPQK